MKNSLFLLGLIALPTISFAGGIGNLELHNAVSNVPAPITAPVVAAPSNISSENPLSILETRGATSTNTDLLRYSFNYIPRSFWAEYNTDLEDINGSIEAEEYFGETRRASFASNGSAEREDERQDRAVNKAQRIRFINR